MRMKHGEWLRQVDRGYLSPCFVNKAEDMSADEVKA